MAKRPKEIFEGSDFNPPTAGDFADDACTYSWVSSNVSLAMQFKAIVWLGRNESKRMRLTDCRSRDEFLSRVDALETPDVGAAPSVRFSSVTNLEEAKKAFLQFPLENEDILDELWGKMQKDYREWITPESKYVAPYFAVVQSSGWGKSRLVSELHRKGLYTVYVSCMKPGSTGFPGRTRLLADRICTADATPQSMAAFLIGSIQVLGEFVGEKQEQASPELWTRLQIDPALGFPLSTRIRAATSQALKELERSTEIMEAENKSKREQEKQQQQSQLQGQLKTFSRRPDRYRKKLKDEYGHLGQALVNAVAHLPVDDIACTGGGGKHLKVLFCIDEATSLAETKSSVLQESCFALLRRVLGTVSHGVWGLFLGTNSRFANFAPPTHLDTTKKATELGYQLFKPFWLTGTSASSGDFLGNGRPLWRALLGAGGYSPENVVKLASEKLNVDPKKLTEEMVVGVLGCTIGVEVAAWSEVAERSMTYHMMTASWISDDGKLIHVMNAAEPVLAAAGARFLLNSAMLCEFVKLVSKMFKEGVVTPGPRGELVTRLLLLLAILMCLKDKGDDMYTGTVTLEEFLIKLLGRVPAGLAGTVELDSELQFNGFTPTYRDLTQELLNECFRLHRGLTCKPGPRAVDNVLPTSKGNVGIQAKRWKKDHSTNMQKAVVKLEKGVDDVKFMLGVVLQVGSQADTVEVAGVHRRTIVVCGLSHQVFPFLHENAAGALQELLKLDTAGHMLQMTDKEKDIARRAFPISYNM